MYWRCTVLTRCAEERIESFSGSRKEVCDLLSSKGIQMIDMNLDYVKSFSALFVKRKLSSLVMANLFKDFHNLLETGMNLSQAVLVLKETSQDELLVRILSKIEVSMQQGQSLTETFSQMDLFPWIVSVTLSAGEKAGRLSYAMGILGDYFKQSHHVKAKLKQALIYPSIVFFTLIALMFFICLQIVPQLKSLLPENALGNHLTQTVLAASFFIQTYLWFLCLLGVVAFIGTLYLIKKKIFNYQVWLYQWPVLGGILKESALALYLLNLSVLLKSGTPLLRAISDLNALDQTLVSKHFEKICDYILGGSSFWQSIEQDPFFPRVVSSTLRRAEEMAKLEDYCFTLSEYFQKRINNKIEGLIHIIQPALLGMGGVFLVVIAIAFLFPIYGNLTTIAGG